MLIQFCLRFKFNCDLVLIYYFKIFLWRSIIWNNQTNDKIETSMNLFHNMSIYKYKEELAKRDNIQPWNNNRSLFHLNTWRLIGQVIEYFVAWAYYINVVLRIGFVCYTCDKCTIDWRVLNTTNWSYNSIKRI